MQIANFEQTGLESIESWLKKNKITELAEATGREALKTSNIYFTAENITRVQSTLLCELKDSYVQQSQRYVDMKEDAYLVPDLKAEDKQKAKELINKAFNLYNQMSELKNSQTSGRPSADDYKYGIPIEDARYILPLAAKTNISVAMTGDKLYNLFKLLHDSKYWSVFSEFRTEIKKLLPDLLINILPTGEINNQGEQLLADLYQDQFNQLDSNHRMVLFSSFDDLDLKVGLGAATSTSAEVPSQKLADWKPNEISKARSLTKRVLGYGHESIAEQARTTFGMMCSMVTYHQQIRHRLSENHREKLIDLLSTKNRQVLVPPTIKESQFADQFRQLAQKIKKFRCQLLNKYSPDQVLPFLLNCDQIKMIIATNARIDNQMLAERICMNAQWEIRDLSTQKLMQLRKLSDILYEQALPSCIHGDCKEGALSCGQQKAMRDKFRTT